MKVAVLGVGNILLKDEGIGVRAVEVLRERYTFPESVELIDGGTMGLDLLPFIEGKERILILDAVNVEKPPGTLVTIEGDDIPKFLSMKLSVHQIGLPDMLSAAKFMDIMPNDLCLIGMQPKTMETGYGLSDDIEDKIDILIERALEKLDEWGVKPVKKETENKPA
jgi:hydrogenase maturation protease